MSEDVTDQVRAFFARTAAAWERWSGVMQRDDTPLYIEAAGVTSGDRVLEVGAGAGEQTVALAAKVGPQGAVVATDLSPEMLDAGARRARDAGFDNVRFVAAGIGSLDLDEESFDACVSGFTWEFLADPLAGAAEVLRLLVPGGRFAATVWDKGPSVPMREIVGAVVLSELGLPRPDLGVGLADDGRFSAVIAGAGFEDVSVSEVTVTMRWATPEAYAGCMSALAPHFQDLIDVHDPHRSEEIWAAVADAAAEHTDEHGTVRLSNGAFMGVGVRPT